MNQLSGYLYANPSFLEGVARLMDISGSLSEYNIARTPEEADMLALWADWQVVGDDLRQATFSYPELNKLQDLYPIDGE